MKPWGNKAMGWQLGLLSLLATLVVADDKPSVKVTKFDHMPANLNYFEDSDSVVFHDTDKGKIYWSENAGRDWEAVKDVPDGKALGLFMHPYEHKTAFILTRGKKHFMTTDAGKKWNAIDVKMEPSRFQPIVMSFHASDPKRIIFNGMVCESIFCEEQAMFTTDGFKTVNHLRGLTAGCFWAKSSPSFTTKDKDLDLKRTICIVKDPISPSKTDQRLMISDNFFEIKNDRYTEIEPKMDTNKAVTGVVNLAIVNSYLVVATASFRSDEMALFVTDDSIKWHRAVFPEADKHDHSHRINQGAYTVLESTNYSIQVDVMTSRPSRDHSTGVLFTSNSNGTYFTENIPYTNRNDEGLVDFEKISGIQGIYLINVVDNGEEVEKDKKSKKVITKITFDDGRNFATIKAGDDSIHLHSVTELNNIGKVYSSPAPGLVMGNGNTGKHLEKYENANLYVSDDAGMTWKEALKGPHKYEFGGSGSILVAVKDVADVDEVSYSLDHGEKWEKMKLPDDLKIHPEFLTTTQDSTSLKFILAGKGKDKAHRIIAIDFGGLKKPECKDSDMEDWHARVDKDGKPTCIMGRKQTYRRRKKSADCVVKSDFHEPEPKIEVCECSDADFECDYNFQRNAEDDKKCDPIGPVLLPDGACKSDDKKFKGSSGWRLIPGNSCKRKDGKQKDDTIERECKDGQKGGDKDGGKGGDKDGDEGDGSSPNPPASGEVKSSEHKFDSKLKDFQKFYLERGDASASDDETIIVRPAEPAGGGELKIENHIWLSSDHGKKWERIFEKEKIHGIYPHKYFSDMVFFTSSKDSKVFYTIDRGKSFHPFKTPSKVDSSFPLSFHPDRKDWLLWIGNQCDEVNEKKQCSKVASVSVDRGDNWKTLLRYVEECEFTGNTAYNFRPLTQVICLAHQEESEDSPTTIFTFDDFTSKDLEEKKTKFNGSVTAFGPMSEFIILTRKDKETDDDHIMASLDGKRFESAHFPYNFKEGHGLKYTLLDSSTHAVNLFARTEAGADRHFGSIIKSNSNGTSYVLSASNVNADGANYVDYEKVAGLEGVALINVVTNPGKGERTKDLQTKISYNDGHEWGYLAPPRKDVEGKSYKCSSSKGETSCALHLHHYTERDDKRKTFAASAAVGIIFGVGNVGQKLGDIKDAETFMTTDGGITWKNVKKGHWTWQYGDQGSIIVLVQRATSKSDVKTNTVTFSVDGGETWKDYKFRDEKATVLDITTVSTGTSRNFLLWCRDGDKLFSVNLDFSGFADKPCKYSEGRDSDYELWSQKHPLQPNDCLFGHRAKYLRKKSDRKCYNDQNIQRHQELENCKCTRQDFEW